MNTLTFSRAHVLAPPVLFLAGAVLAAQADTSFTATGWLNGVPSPGITCSNSSGVYLKGNVHVVRLLSDEARVRGRLQAWMDLAYQTNGTALFCGPAYSEVGTWDPAGASFTPSGGVWALNYSGVIQADGSTRYSMTGYGIGGAIEGMRTSVTATRTNSDPTTPYLISGIIKSAPVDATVLLDDFNDGLVKQEWVAWSSGTPYLDEANGQLTIRGVWDREATQPVLDCSTADWFQDWSVPDGQTVEWRAEVVGMNQDAGVVGIGVGTSGTRFYQFGVAGDHVFLYRWTSTGDAELIFSDPAAVRQTNITISFALTRHASEAIIGLRVQDRTTAGVTLYQTNLLDHSPFLSGNNAVLGIEPKPELQASDASVTFDNFTKRTYEVPQIGYERALRLVWPDIGMNFIVEGASSAEGPYFPVQNSEIPGMHYIMVPTSAAKEFFRLQQAP